MGRRNIFYIYLLTLIALWFVSTTVAASKPKAIEAHNPTANTIWIILDNARYYYNKDVLNFIENSSKLEVRFLPPYSPNLNLIERVWRFFKKKILYNQFYPSFQEFKKACGDFFTYLPNYYDDLVPLISDEFQIIEI